MPRWSHSRLFKLFHCGEAFRRYYIEGERPPGTLSMHRGTAVAEAVRQSHLPQLEARTRLGPGNYTQEDLNQVLPPVDVVQDIAATAWEERTREGISYTDEERERPAASRGRSKDDAVHMATLYRDNIATTVDPAGVERRTVFRPRGLVTRAGEQIEVVSIRDVVQETADGRVVRDQKTTGKSPARGLADDSPQLSLYALAEYAETRKLPHKLTLDHLVVTPSGVGKVVVQETVRTPGQVRAVVERIRTAQQLVEAGVFPPANPGGLCSARWCAFWSTCRYVGNA